MEDTSYIRNIWSFQSKRDFFQWFIPANNAQFKILDLYICVFFILLQNALCNFSVT